VAVVDHARGLFVGPGDELARARHDAGDDEYVPGSSGEKRILVGLLSPPLEDVHFCFFVRGSLGCKARQLSFQIVQLKMKTVLI